MFLLRGAWPLLQIPKFNIFITLWVHKKHIKKSICILWKPHTWIGLREILPNLLPLWQLGKHEFCSLNLWKSPTFCNPFQTNLNPPQTLNPTTTLEWAKWHYKALSLRCEGACCFTTFPLWHEGVVVLWLSHCDVKVSFHNIPIAMWRCRSATFLSWWESVTRIVP
jgi:hypothetical protein